MSRPTNSVSRGKLDWQLIAEDGTVDRRRYVFARVEVALAGFFTYQAPKIIMVTTKAVIQFM
ncbi:MAG: hypothetical protein ACOC6I_02880 [Candidatus Bipolaricaulota bacterium]